MPWDTSNPLYRWKMKHSKVGKHRKANKSKAVHMSPVRPMARKARRRSTSRARRFYHRSKKMTIPVAPMIGLLAPAESGGLISNVITGNFADVPSSAAWSFLGYGSDK